MKRHTVNARSPPKRLSVRRFRLIVRHSDKSRPNTARNRQYGPGADADNFTQPLPRCHNRLVADMNIDENGVLRLRICGHAACQGVFTICARCDRGQRYCSPKCRLEVRRRQRHDANRRYQQSEPGRQSHRRCQQRYRGRASQPVTDQGIVPITSPAPPQRATVCQCAICGRHSLWIDPFPSVPRRYRSAGRIGQHHPRRRRNHPSDYPWVWRLLTTKLQPMAALA
jgi:hypothetical protein